MTEEPNFLAQYQEAARASRGLVAVHVESSEDVGLLRGLLAQQGERGPEVLWQVGCCRSDSRYRPVSSFREHLGAVAAHPQFRNAMADERSELRSLGSRPPKPAIWVCAHCECKVQIIVDPVHPWEQPFVCVCGTPMEPTEVHEAELVARSHCAHCWVQIIDDSTAVDVDGERFCCPNCAATVARAAEHRERN